MNRHAAMLFLLTIVVSSSNISSLHADVLIQNGRGDVVDVEALSAYADVTILREISKADVDVLRSIIGKVGLTGIRLESPGGDVYAAMEMGRIIRSAREKVFVPINGRCLSSCALIYISGVRRFNLGEIGLHRPYVTGSPQSQAEIERFVETMISDVRAYVSEMGITEEFADVMINTPPANMRIYKVGEETERLVPYQDALDEELKVAEGARQRGISTDEFRRREVDADNICTMEDVLAKFHCQQAVTWGLSLPIYNARDELASERCVSDSEGWKVIRSLSKAERFEHPEILKLERCIREVMQGQHD